MRLGKAATHDYTQRYWGHDYTVMESHDAGLRLGMAGWGSGISKGDYILISQRNDDTTRYRISQIEYKSDPPDMWFATAKFAPRTKAEKGGAA